MKPIDIKEFYNERYIKGYMESWPADKKARVAEVIKSLSLPSSGDALDIGCGNGVFTVILKNVLKNWNIYGCDISKEAVANAARNNPDCTFFVSDDPQYAQKKFDFIFSHHVLEHVEDIQEFAKEIYDRTHAGSTMLHILPCGNTGSFEWKLCSLRKDGINKDIENRFFFEDEGHLRRMTTESCERLFKSYDFVLKKGLYSNQQAGAMNWITRSHPTILLKMFNPIKGKNVKAKLVLILLLAKFLFIAVLRLPWVVCDRYLPYPFKSVGAMVLFPSRYLDRYLISQSEKEWKAKQLDPQGSEMYLYFSHL